MPNQPTLIASVQRALNLLDAVGAADRPQPAKALARRTGQPLPTTYHLLRTLVHEGYLRKVDGLGYVLGERVAALSSGPGRSAARVAGYRAVLQRLHRELSAAAYLSVLEEGEIRLVDVVDSPSRLGWTCGWGSTRRHTPPRSARPCCRRSRSRAGGSTWRSTTWRT